MVARQGKSIRQIARDLCIARNTVRKYLRCDEIARYGPRQPRPTKLDALKEYLLERIGNGKPHWIAAVSRDSRAGYGGGLTQLKTFINWHKPQRIEPLLRFEIKPGQQMHAGVDCDKTT